MNNKEKYYRRDFHRNLSLIMALAILVLVVGMLFALTKSGYNRTFQYAENDVAQDAEDISALIDSTLGFALNGIQVAAFGLSQYYTDVDDADDPSLYIQSILGETPFHDIQYFDSKGKILTDGYPGYDASGMEFFIEGMDGDTGIWINYNPVYADEVMIDFYAPVRKGIQIIGVVVGNLGTESVIREFMRTTFFEKNEYSVLLSSDNKVIVDSEGTKGGTDLTVLLEGVSGNAQEKAKLLNLINGENNASTMYYDNDGRSFAAVRYIEVIGWKVVTFIPNESIRKFSLENNIGIYKMVTMILVSVIVLFCLLVYNDKKHFDETVQLLNLDGPTPFFRRRVYEEDVNSRYLELSDDFIYVSFDLNGLKTTNDTLGHKAGDELIVGASACIQAAFGDYGRLYRTGGDEFVALINCDYKSFEGARICFLDKVNQWKGIYSSSLSVSMGYASHEEYPNLSVQELAKLADEKMYIEKNIYYRKKGIDRRGMADVYDILKNTYETVIKVNLTTDTFSVMKLDDAEVTEDTRSGNGLNSWNRHFASKYVHEDDRDEYIKNTSTDYLREYFHSNTTLVFEYRRITEGEYRNALMEILQSKDYADDNQVVYLFAKNISK